MRVYGTTPLYNYVELVCRSKRLFFGSILIASLATTFFYFYRANSYSARTLVLLTGTQTPNQDDKDQKGTIQYKLSILNLVLRDPNFVKTALKADGLDQNMTGEQFDKFAKDVKDKVSYAVTDNVLEISCTWPDARAANIVNAVYGAYSRRVLEEETFLSSTNTKLVSDLLHEYTQQRNKVESIVAQYKKAHALNMSIDTEPATAAYQQAQQNMVRLKSDEQVANARLNLLREQLKTTPRTVTESTIRRGDATDLTYINAQQARIEAKNKLDELKLKYTDIDPKVKAAQQRLDAAEEDLKKFTTRASTTNKATGPIATQVEAVNSQYTSLSQQIKTAEIDLKALNAQVAQSEKDVAVAEARARTTPDEQYNFHRMTDNLNLYESFQNQFAVKLETAKMEEKRDKAYKLQEIKQVVTPESEPDNKGARGFLILLAGPLLGIIVAFAFSLLAEAMDHSVRTPLEVEQFLGKPVLAVLPRVKTPRAGVRHQLSSDPSRPSLPSTEG